MWRQPENDQFAEELHLAAERVPPGVYLQVGTGRRVCIETEDTLPASLDGQVACYIRVRSTWSELQQP